MKNRILNPQIMLLRGSIEYQRVENKFSSLEPQILQEREFLRNSVSKITKFYPNVLVVEKTVSRLAQDFLLDAGITLIFNVKPKVMERLARFTQADIVPSIDSLVGLPQLGVCHSFRSQAYTLPSGESKTVVVFDGCATHLGCTVLLRGSLVTELQKVKEIIQFMSYCSYNSLLEISYCMDEFALLPEEKDIDIEHEEYKRSNLLTVPNRNESDSSLETMNNENHNPTTSTSESESNSGALKNSMQNQSKNTDSKETKPPMVNIKTEPDKSKVEIKRQQSAALVELTDESDPLKRYQKSQDDSIFQSRLSLKEQKHSSHRKFKKILHDTMLSVSPYHKYEVPYLESDVGMKCRSRKFLPEEIYWSRLFEDNPSRRTRSKGHEGEMNGVIANNKKNIQMADPHPFITCKMTAPLSEQSTQAMLADFRARGGRVKVTNKADLWVNHTTSKNESEHGKNSTSNDKMDCLDPVNHQKISVLFSNFSPKSFNFPNHCVLPWVVTMDFYGNNDISLGAFLQRFCFRESYMCPSATCETSILDHVRRFSHGKGCINIILKKLETAIPGGQNNILMWSWCRKCKQVTPVVPISADTWSLSFAKYLELRFYGNQFLRRASAEQCCHSLHYQHNQYFGHQDILVSFKYTEISLKELALPSIVIDILMPMLNANIMKDQVLLITNRSMERYSEILECTLNIKSEIQSESSARTLSEFVTEQQNEKSQLRELATKIQEKIDEIGNQGKTTSPVEVEYGNQGKTISPLKEEIDGPNMTLSEIYDDIIRLKRLTTEAVVRWNTKIQEFLNHQQKKQARPLSATRKDKESLEDADRHSPRLPSSTHSSGETNQPAISTISSLVESVPDPVFQFKIPGEPEQKNSNTLTETTNIFGEKSYIPSDRLAENKNILREKTQVCHKPDVPGEKLKIPAVEKLHTVVDKLQVPTDKTNLPPQKSSDKLPNLDADDVSDGRAGDRRAAVKRALMFWQGPAFQPLALPYDASEHYLLPPCERVPVVVYDNEPSSIIAYALSSSDYHNKLKEIQNSLRVSKEVDLNGTSSKVSDPNTTDLQGKRTAGGVLSFFRGANTVAKDVNVVTRPGVSLDSVRYNPQLDSDSIEVDHDSDSSTTIPGTNNSDNLDKTKSTVKQSLGPHIEIQFSDNLARFYCRVYFAEQFRKIRKVIFPSGEDVFIRSLSRCKLWEAKGGKSGSTFCKTDDDRFILKQMSGMEVESFEKFGPQYFNYVTITASEKRPITLAKIVGVFRIGFRNTQTNSANKQDLLVVENLFYNRKISQKFDLKGSMRNRLVNTSGKREEELVLLDENLLKLSVDSPLYIRPHSKTVLKTAITSDSQFLSNNLVMDYSLIVGLDEINQELVVGIIDYIRTFTWDKKLEMVFKSSGLMGGHGKMPTVVSPQLYRSRFLEAMERYFLHVPDQWSGLGKDFPGPSEKTTTNEEDKK